MTRKAHDKFAKEYLEELLSPFGSIEKSKQVTSENREIDFFFTPNNLTNNDNLPLGILAYLTQSSCLIEPYRNPCTDEQIRMCLLKLYTIHGEIIREAERNKTPVADRKFPLLWILTPTCSQRILQGFSAQEREHYPQGVYFLGQYFYTAIIVIHQLPINEDTLWLRILGKGNTQKQAIEQVVSLPSENPFRDNLLEILANWRKELELRKNLTKDEEETFMNLSPAYLKEREVWRQEGKIEMIQNFLKVRFQSVDSDLEQIIPQMLQIPSEELTTLLFTLNREELLRRFKEELN